MILFRYEFDIIKVKLSCGEIFAGYQRVSRRLILRCVMCSISYIECILQATPRPPNRQLKNCSSSDTSGSAFVFLIFPSATNRAFSSAIRLSNPLAGSSFGSCGTNLPRTASSRISSRSF